MRIKQIGSLIIDFAIFLFLVSSIAFAVTSNKEKTAISTLKKPVFKVTESKEDCMLKAYITLELAEKNDIHIPLEEGKKIIDRCD